MASESLKGKTIPRVPEVLKDTPARWEWERLQDICEGIYDCPNSTPKLTIAGPYVARTQDILTGIFLESSAGHVSEGTYAKRVTRAEPRRGDLLYSREGTYFGIAAEVPLEVRVCLGQRMVLIRPNVKIVNFRFLRYWLNSPAMAAYIHGFRDGSVAERLNLPTIRSLPVLIPPMGEQAAIAAVLAALDDKIAVNDQIVRACDELRVARFAHWKQRHPESIKECPLSSVADFVNGRAFTKDATGTGRMVIRIAEINSGPGGSTIYNDIDVPDVHLARPGDVLFAWSGSLAVARWFRAEGIINQHIFKVIPGAGIPSWLVFDMVNSKLSMFKRIAADKATTMGHIQRYHLDALVACPVPGCISELNSALGGLWDRALKAEQESLKLAELRDTLLPKLISGEIRVRDAEKVVEDVT